VEDLACVGPHIAHGLCIGKIMTGHISIRIISGIHKGNFVGPAQLIMLLDQLINNQQFPANHYPTVTVTRAYKAVLCT
jgi:hypothetical protein